MKLYTLFMTDSHEIIYPVYDREVKKNIPCPAAHPRVGHIGKYSLLYCDFAS